MSKKENEQLYGMCEFIYHIYALASLEVPENFNPEEQAIVISNSLKYKGRIEMANCLLLAEKNEDERKRQHEGWTDCNTQLDLASRESEHYREALKTIADPSTTCMSWSETVHCLRAHARNALKPMTS